MSQTSNTSKRLDNTVVELMPQLSRSFAVKLIEEGKVLVNGATNLKAGTKLRGTEDITINYSVSQLDEIPDISLPILYEDDDCVVIDKPTGLLVHSKGKFNPEATVATWLSKRTNGELIGDRAGIVHRLDRVTSGVMIAAKTQGALIWLQKQFSLRKVKKTYYAIAQGHLPHQHAIIEMPIERNPKKPQSFKTSLTGKPALTEYWVETSNDNLTLAKLSPQTGRTHQLRVHLTEIGHPILGDVLYGGQAADRLYLHSYELEITLPNRTRKTFKSKLPEAFKAKL